MVRLLSLSPIPLCAAHSAAEGVISPVPSPATPPPPPLPSLSDAAVLRPSSLLGPKLVATPVAGVSAVATAGAVAAASVVAGAVAAASTIVAVAATGAVAASGVACDLAQPHSARHTALFFSGEISSLSTVKFLLLLGTRVAFIAAAAAAAGGGGCADPVEDSFGDTFTPLLLAITPSVIRPS